MITHIKLSAAIIKTNLVLAFPERGMLLIVDTHLQQRFLLILLSGSFFTVSMVLNITVTSVPALSIVFQIPW